MSTERTAGLSPRIVREIEQMDASWETRSPSFLNWVVEEIDRLRAGITSDTTREERFRIQNDIASLSGPAHRYGQWLYHRSAGTGPRP
jgi:hypothetical protein